MAQDITIILNSGTVIKTRAEDIQIYINKITNQLTGYKINRNHDKDDQSLRLLYTRVENIDAILCEEVKK